MRQASDLDTLLKITVAQIREKIGCDRALIYEFISLESGNVLAESRTLGWTPTLSENIPGIIFGLYSRKAAELYHIQTEEKTITYASNLDEPELLDLIFSPGFSTANKVSEISGRGMGLDIVRTQMHALNGSISV